ncbi:NACHT domain-containing protein [filamentous cyanobacterium LEGE 11480]|uniref:NACHT domain-containing protein n=1 Tax=Romeriopsis navalis LEGE 11480 TaxID=2777977 RepID=A0A928Z536_9CYAN|nr:NACHT domain-containing protein [Romeriopsis navalis]MBE9033256.1 NACHT domain-containing protein [Romeriopsis navalis LEGE 11480]
MAKRSFKASPEGIAIAKRAFERREWTQEYLASAVGLQTRQSIWKFFTGRPIERYLFIDICFQLDLDWEEIVYRAPIDETADQASTQASANDTELAQAWAAIYPDLSAQLHQQYRCAPHLVDIHYPIDLENLYIDRRVTTQPPTQSWLDAVTLERQTATPEQADFREVPLLQAAPSGHNHQFLIDQRRRDTSETATATAPSLPITQLLAQHKQVLLYGEIGAGKSTVIQALALQAIATTDEPPILPLQISLTALGKQIPASHAGKTTPKDQTETLATTLLAHWQCAAITPALGQWLFTQGKVLLLLDGFDQVPADARPALTDAIQQFAQAYPATTIVLTSRGDRRTCEFAGFTSAHIVPLNHAEITQFAERWFKAINLNETIAQQFLTQLFDKRNQRLQSLATSPLLLHILCSIFRDCQTLPENRSRLYQHILELHLGDWDQLRHITRNPHPCTISLTELISLLSELSYTEFEAGNHFFEKNKIIAILANYVAPADPATSNHEKIWQQSESLLEQLILEHGIFVESAKGVYRFAHLAFQEYLSARYIFAQTLTREATHPPDSQNISPLIPVLAQKLHHSGWQTHQALYNLAHHALDPRWHEVIFLTLDLLPDRDYLLERLKRQIDRVILLQPRFKTFFNWIEHKVEQTTTAIGDNHNLAALRAFYFSSVLNLGLDLAGSLDPQITWQLPKPLAQDLQLIQLSNWLQDFTTNANVNSAIQICFTLQAIVTREDTPAAFNESLTVLQTHVIAGDLGNWDASGQQAWAMDLQTAITQTYNIGHTWEWQQEEWQQLEAYYWSNVFLLECLQRYTATNPTSHINKIRQLFKPRGLQQTDVAMMPHIQPSRMAR